jgi:7-keto-8-aminopelargonate synthetase-like enzyme
MTEPEPLEFIGANEVRFQNRTLVYFSGCDFFRLARDPRLAAAARNSLAKSGLNVAASRLTTGNHEIYARLENELAKFFAAESALVFPNGYLGPLAVASALAGEISHALLDEMAHGTLADAARMLDCPVKKFRHRNTRDLEKALSKCGKHARPLILTDGVFSHDGSVAPLRDYLKILPRAGRMLVDDAYGGGVLGAKGQGTLEFEKVGRARVIQCATLSKAFGSYGGVVLSSRAVREKIIARSRAFAGSTPLPPPLAGAALAAVKILAAEPQRRKRLFQNVAFVRENLRSAGWEIPETPGAIVRLPVLPEAQERALKKRLLTAGIYPPYLRYGNMMHGTFRFIVSSEHSPVHLEKLCAVLAVFKNNFPQP